ncbi:hypothetical protein Taro_036201, partial [Colocasia esculenta]|nr:hypothetical protein [Colocasia esculenta]
LGPLFSPARLETEEAAAPAAAATNRGGGGGQRRGVNSPLPPFLQESTIPAAGSPAGGVAMGSEQAFPSTSSSSPSSSDAAVDAAGSSLGSERQQASCLGAAVIPIVNRLQDIFAQLGDASTIKLPQVAVVGSQSSGKSSVLEALVGRDFLPRGNDICTRRPLVLQLVQVAAPGEGARAAEWGEFLHRPGQRFEDFSEIRREIEVRSAGSRRTISFWEAAALAGADLPSVMGMCQPVSGVELVDGQTALGSKRCVDAGEFPEGCLLKRGDWLRRSLCAMVVEVEVQAEEVKLRLEALSRGCWEVSKVSLISFLVVRGVGGDRGGHSGRSFRGISEFTIFSSRTVVSVEVTVPSFWSDVAEYVQDNVGCRLGAWNFPGSASTTVSRALRPPIWVFFPTRYLHLGSFSLWPLLASHRSSCWLGTLKPGDLRAPSRTTEGGELKGWVFRGDLVLPEGPHLSSLELAPLDPGVQWEARLRIRQGEALDPCYVDCMIEITLGVEEGEDILGTPSSKGIETEREAGSNQGISDKQIRLKIFSPNVLDITLVDLPGITKVPVGSRTIGVITKLDIMDRGTDACKFLLGKVIPLRLGYIGVVNRGQLDIIENRSIAEALANEEKFFRSRPVYHALADRCGIPQLAKKLNQILVQHIRMVLPEVKARLNAQMVTVLKELRSYGEAMESTVC